MILKSVKSTNLIKLMSLIRLQILIKLMKLTKLMWILMQILIRLMKLSKLINLIRLKVLINQMIFIRSIIFIRLTNSCERLLWVIFFLKMLMKQISECKNLFHKHLQKKNYSKKSFTRICQSDEDYWFNKDHLISQNLQFSQIYQFW